MIGDMFGSWVVLWIASAVTMILFYAYMERAITLGEVLIAIGISAIPLINIICTAVLGVIVFFQSVTRIRDLFDWDISMNMTVWRIPNSW